MIEGVLIGVILLLCGLLVWKERETRLERNKFINALLARNVREMVDLEVADKIEPKTEIPKEPDLIPVEDLNDEEFKKAIL